MARSSTDLLSSTISRVAKAVTNPLCFTKNSISNTSSFRVEKIFYSHTLPVLVVLQA